MQNKPYYHAYEKRYQAVYAAGIEYWGHEPDDEILTRTLTDWVHANNLVGKRVIEFACGEGASGVILSRLGCQYLGVDIAPSALEKARARLAEFPNAQVRQMNMISETVDEPFDAALDCMGYHMLITDSDRAQYLHNAFSALKNGAPMLFFRETYDEAACTDRIENPEQWQAVTGSDYNTPQLRRTSDGKEVRIPLIPARAQSEAGYRREMTEAGFTVEEFRRMEESGHILYSASIFVRKP